MSILPSNLINSLLPNETEIIEFEEAEVITKIDSYHLQVRLIHRSEQTVIKLPVYYMECSADAFQVGDKVIIWWLENMRRGIIIGFAQTPRNCP